MGNGDGCTVFRNPLQRFLNCCFCIDIKGGCRFVQNQDAWIMKDCASNRYSLSLSA